MTRILTRPGGSRGVVRDVEHVAPQTGGADRIEVDVLHRPHQIHPEQVAQIQVDPSLGLPHPPVVIGRRADVEERQIVAVHQLPGLDLLRHSVLGTYGTDLAAAFLDAQGNVVTQSEHLQFGQLGAFGLVRGLQVEIAIEVIAHVKGQDVLGVALGGAVHRPEVQNPGLLAVGLLARCLVELVHLERIRILGEDQAHLGDSHRAAQIHQHPPRAQWIVGVGRPARVQISVDDRRESGVVGGRNGYPVRNVDAPEPDGVAVLVHLRDEFSRTECRVDRILRAPDIGRGDLALFQNYRARGKSPLTDDLLGLEDQFAGAGNAGRQQDQAAGQQEAAE